MTNDQRRIQELCSERDLGNDDEGRCGASRGHVVVTAEKQTEGFRRDEGAGRYFFARTVRLSG